MQRKTISSQALMTGLMLAISLSPAYAQSPTPVAGHSSPFMGLESADLNENNVKQIKAAGASWVRRNALLWSAVEPQEGARDWSAVASIEEDLKLASSYGLNVILIVRSTPAWAQAQEGVACGAVLPDKLPALGAFMHDLVARYSKAPFNVRVYEFWNEPDVDPSLVPPENIFGCWGDASDAFYGGGTYAAAMKAIYPQVKAASRLAQLLHGGLLLDCDPDHPPAGKDCRASRFFEGVLKSGGASYFDAVSFHAYDFYTGKVGQYANVNWASDSAGGPVIAAKARFLRTLLARYGAPGKPLINTESGVLCWECSFSPADFETTKAYYVPQAFAQARAERLMGNIWYSWEGWFQTQLVNEDGTTTQAYAAFQVAAKYIGRTSSIRPKQDLEGVLGYQFAVGGERYWLLWSKDGQPRQITAPILNRHAFDHVGQPVQVNGQSVTVDARPIYIQVR